MYLHVPDLSKRPRPLASSVVCVPLCFSGRLVARHSVFSSLLDGNSAGSLSTTSSTPRLPIGGAAPITSPTPCFPTMPRAAPSFFSAWEGPTLSPDELLFQLLAMCGLDGWRPPLVCVVPSLCGTGNRQEQLAQPCTRAASIFSHLAGCFCTSGSFSAYLVKLTGTSV